MDLVALEKRNSYSKITWWAKDCPILDSWVERSANQWMTDFPSKEMVRLCPYPHCRQRHLPSSPRVRGVLSKSIPHS